MIPHDLLMELIKKSGVTPVSQMQYIRAGLNKQGRSHVLSFRRQIFIKEEDISRIPPSLQVVYDNTPYWVYLSTDSTSCFLCKQTGHVAKQCPEFNENLEGNSSQSTTQENSTATHDSNKLIVIPSHLVNDKNQLKRPPPPSTGSSEKSLDTQFELFNPRKDQDEKNNSESESENHPTDSLFKTPKRSSKPPVKVARINTRTSKDSDLEKDLFVVQKHIEESLITHVLDYQQFRSFLEKSYGKSNTIEIAREYTDDFEGLVIMLDEVSSNLTGKLKSRCYRLKKKLQKFITGDTGSESSQQEDE